LPIIKSEHTVEVIRLRINAYNMNPFTKLSYLVLIIFPVLLMFIIFIAVSTVGHGAAKTDFLWDVSIVAFINGIFLGYCMIVPHEQRSWFLKWVTILLAILSIIVSIVLLIGSFVEPFDSFITPILFVVALLTIICGLVVIVDNSKAVRS
jgi:hypothetical protein